MAGGKGLFTDPSNWKYFRNPFRPSWGEPYAQIAARVLAAVRAARSRVEGTGREAVLVSHQLPIVAARRKAEGLRLFHDPRQRQCGLASVTSFTFDGDVIVRDRLRRAGRRRAAGRPRRRRLTQNRPRSQYSEAGFGPHRRVAHWTAMKSLRVAAGLLAGSAAALVSCAARAADPVTARTAITASQQLGHADHGRRPQAGRRLQRQPADGGTYKLTQDAGKVTVVNFWGQWCAPCKVETPQFGLVYEAYKARTSPSSASTSRSRTASKPRAFVKDNKITLPDRLRRGRRDRAAPGQHPGAGRCRSPCCSTSSTGSPAVYIARCRPKDLEPVLNKLIAEK